MICVWFIIKVSPVYVNEFMVSDQSGRYYSHLSKVYNMISANVFEFGDECKYSLSDIICRNHIMNKKHVHDLGTPLVRFYYNMVYMMGVNSNSQKEVAEPIKWTQPLRNLRSTYLSLMYLTNLTGCL